MKETEVKFRVKDWKEFKRIAKKLRELNAILLWQGREINCYFDTARRELKDNSMVLRVRNWKGKESTITLKIDENKKRPRKFKIREELQIKVDNINIAKRILENLGFKQWLKYSKNRSHWSLGKIKVEVDHLGKKFFIEIEGSKKDIEKTAKLLGLSWTQSTTKSYIDLIRESD
ncbi:MAG: class IV adenylate cyclase [Parcubacteria group bacterium]|nr:class IV adenylate cyclase [Parcubacteria group bacterium]